MRIYCPKCALERQQGVQAALFRSAIDKKG